jgi:hypothetical protein
MTMRSTVGHNSGGHGLAASAACREGKPALYTSGSAVGTATDATSTVGVAAAAAARVGTAVAVGVAVTGAVFTGGVGSAVAACSAELTMVSLAASVASAAGVADSAVAAAVAASAGVDAFAPLALPGTVHEVWLKTLRTAFTESEEALEARAGVEGGPSSDAPVATGMNATTPATPRANPVTTRPWRTVRATTAVSAPTTRGYYG